MSTPSRRRSAVTGAAVVSVGFMTLALAAPAFTAASNSPQTMVRKSVQTLMDPDGTVQATRLYTQIQSTGDGNVSFTDQTSGSLRNLNGFGVPPVSAGTVSWDFAVSGLNNQRTLQDYVKGDLPIKVKVEATLDGQPLSANDVLGKTGLLKMTYTISNETSVDQTITWKDGTGAEQSKTEKVPIPFVGSFSTTLSDSYADINAPGASMGGTGRNSTQLNYNLLLYKPLGDTTEVITYEARVTNADIPSVDMTFLPAGPAENASTKALQDQIKGGADSGVQITDAGSQIDANLLKLAAGAGDLNAGLAKLYAGSQQLADGLNNTAVPGANKLAAGSAALAAGLNNDAVPGAQQVAAGNAALASGLGDAVTGSDALAGGLAAASVGADALSTGATSLKLGLASLNAGLTQLYNAGAALPTTVNTELATNVDYQTLLGTLQTVVDGIGTPTSVPVTPTTPIADRTVMGGLLGVKYGLRTPYGYANNDCGLSLLGITPTKCGAMDAVQYIAAALTTGASDLNGLKALFGALVSGTYGTTICPSHPTPAPPSGNNPPVSYCDAISTLYWSLFAPSDYTTSPAVKGGAQAQVVTAAGALAGTYGQVDTYLIPGIDQLRKTMYNSSCDPAQTDPTASDYCGISQALTLVKGGIPTLVTAITTEISGTLTGALGTGVSPCNPNLTLRCAGNALYAGAGQLDAGLGDLSDGLALLAEGSAKLADGLAPAGPGSNKLAAGSAKLASGLVTAAAGADQVAAGNEQLATGLAPAASGATQIATGIGVNATGCDPTKTLTCGGAAIQSGAQQLSDEGSKKLIAKGNETASGYAEQYALMEALNARSATQAGIPNGPAKGANVTTTGAFGYTLQGATKADSTNWIRFLIAGLVLAAAVGVGIAFARD